ncbi:MAG: ABC transporter ATP-binding protein [Bacteroidia bacterium]
MKTESRMAIYQAENLSQKFPRSSFHLRLNELSLHAGSITGVVGENGNGKTTLLNIIAGEAKAEGSFNYFGAKIDGRSDWGELKEHIGFIPQRIPKWYGTLEQNLYLKAALEGIGYDAIDNRLDELLDFLDLQKYRSLKWTEISTGYRLRFELARVLLGNPRLLVLDEPLANMDINTQQKFLSDLKTLLAKRDKPLAIILSSQQLHEIESVATQMLFLRNGEAIYSGDIAAIADTGTLRIYEFQLNGQDGLPPDFLQEDEELGNNGPYSLIKTKSSSAQLLQRLLTAEYDVKYFRDLTTSTKRFF